MREFSKSLVQKEANPSSIQSHSQAYHTSSHLLKINESLDQNEINDLQSLQSESLDCKIITKK